MRRLLLLLPCLLPATALADGDSGAPRFRLRAPATIEPAPQQGGNYTLEARFAAQPSAGDLREGGRYSLIGRIAAKGSVACGTPAIFDDGFEDT